MLGADEFHPAGQAAARSPQMNHPEFQLRGLPIRDWRCTPPARCRRGWGRAMARGSCGPIRSARSGWKGRSWLWRAADEARAECTVSDDRRHEPSPYVEAAADEPASWSPTFGQSASARMQNEKPSARTPSWLDEPAHTTRKRPAALHLADGCRRPPLARLQRIQPPDRRPDRGRLRSALERHRRNLRAGSRRPRAQAIATRNTWTGITLNWPIDGGSRLPVELSGLPLHDGARNFAGYRGFGVCRDLDALARLDAWRRHALYRRSGTAGAFSRHRSARMIAKVFCSEAAPFVSPALSAFVNSGIHSRPIWKSRGIPRSIRGSPRGNAEERAAVSADQRAERLC